MKYDEFSNRMKGYETVTNMKLTRRTPVIIRLDGNCFHTWTKGLDRPFDEDLHDVMSIVATELCRQIQNCVIAYHQSDEISLLLNDWSKLETDQWFGAKVQKIVSISAAIATAYFNETVQSDVYENKFTGKPLALFDSRVFNIPKEEVCNYFVWRQQDATRNSIQMLGQAHFSQSELQNKNVSDIQDMLMEKDNINWNDIDPWKKRGSCIVKKATSFGCSSWIEDKETPIFTKRRSYIESLL